MPVIHQWKLPVRWDDIDQLRHVNNVVYYRYISEARVAWFDSLGLLMTDDGTAPVVAESGARFLKAVTYPDTVIIDTRLAHLGNSSLKLEYELRTINDSAIHVTGFAVIVWTETQSGKPIPMPQFLRDYLITKL